MPLLVLSAKLERWPEAAQLLKTLIDRGDTGLRWSYIVALSRMGRSEEVLQQIDVLVSEEVQRLPAETASAGPPPGEASPSEILAARGSPGQAVGLAGLLETVAWNLRDAGRDAEAEQLFRRALALSPRSAELHAVLLHLYSTAEERRAHADALERKWQGESDPRALLDEGTQRLAAGDAAGAFDLLRRAAPAYPDLEAPWYNLGIAAFKLHEWATAEEAYRHAAELNPARADSVFFRGVALIYLERCAEATEALQRALEIDPQRVDAHYHLAACYQRLGDAGAAARHRRLYEAAKPP